MSTYVPSEWVNGQQPAINAQNLNHLEAGVLSAHVEIEELVTGAVPVGNSELAEHATTVDRATQTTIGGAKVWVDTTDPDNIIGHLDAR